MSDQPLLDVRDLRVSFRTRRGTVTAVDGLSLSVAPGEILGVVGESGSGKSVSMLAVLRLLTSPNVTVTGQVLFRGRDLLALPDKEMRSVRGREIAMLGAARLGAPGRRAAAASAAHHRGCARVAGQRAGGVRVRAALPGATRQVRRTPGTHRRPGTP